MPQPPAGFRLRGLRARLLGIVLVAVVPLTIALMAYVGFQNSAQEDRTRGTMQDSLTADIRSVRDLISQGRITLETFGITYAIQQHRWDLVQGNADRLRAMNPAFAGISVTDAYGRVQASSPKNGAADLSADESYRKAVASGGFVVSDFTVSPLTGRPTVGVSLPVNDANGKLVAVEYIAFDPGLFAARLTTVGSSSLAWLVDGQGIVIACKPENATAVGLPLTDVGLTRAILDNNGGMVVAHGVSDPDRTYYVAPVFPDGEGSLHAVVGFSEAEVLAPERRAFVITFAGFLSIAVFALIVAWLVGTYSIYRPTLAIGRAAERLAEGDLSARAEFGSQTDELGALRDRFNEMAASLEKHVGDLEETRRELYLLNEDLEERVEHRTAQLEASNKELEAFSYSVSHDLRSPLRAIDGFSLALLEDYSPVLDAHGREDLMRVRANAIRMGELIDGLLRLSRLSRQELKASDVDLSAVANEIAAELREFEPERDVTFKIEPHVHAIADLELVRVVLRNLLGNAWKFTSRHHTATIEFGAEERDGETVYFVRDDGAGFDMAYSAKLFGAFQRVHGQTEFPGTGIGLATAARIVRRHGGRIWAEGELEKGAVFSFTLSGAEWPLGEDESGA